MEFGFRTGIYRHGRDDGPPEFVAAVEVTVDADDEDGAEEMASDKIDAMLAEGHFAGEDLTPI